MRHYSPCENCSVMVPSRREDGPGQLLRAHTEYMLTKKSGTFSFMILEEFGGWRGESQC